VHKFVNRSILKENRQWAENTIMTECTQENGNRQSMYSVVCGKNIRRGWVLTVSPETMEKPGIPPQSYTICGVFILTKERRWYGHERTYYAGNKNKPRSPRKFAVVGIGANPPFSASKWEMGGK
jgi:hypothetical protein